MTSTWVDIQAYTQVLITFTKRLQRFQAKEVKVDSTDKEYCNKFY